MLETLEPVRPWLPRDLAMKCLRQAQAHSGIRTPAERRELEQDRRLAPLHGRANFQAFLRAMKQR